MRIPFEKMKYEFKRILLRLNFAEHKAETIARIFAENSRDGVYTHGLNRFPVFVQYVKEGYVKTASNPNLENSFGSFERWNGNYGAGILNAVFSMDRAIQLAKENGIGCVALKDTNHWMRGGTYGWQAAEAGCIGICFTNTTPNLPPWGGIDPRLGNNPLIIAVPHEPGHIVLDMAVSQYSYGKLHQYDSLNEELPLPGGYNNAGNLTSNPAEIIESRRSLPIGFWKGSGLSLLLDLLVTVLGQGKSSSEIGKEKVETGVSQVFICIKPEENIALTEQFIGQILNYTKSSNMIDPESPIRYPGESTLRTRILNTQQGIPVDEKIWNQILEL